MRCKLVLDLDNTLLCAMAVRFDRVVEPDFLMGQDAWAAVAHLDVEPRKRPLYFVYQRPGVVPFLKTLAADGRFGLVLWTAGSVAYAHATLGGMGVLELFEEVLGFEQCTLRWKDKAGVFHQEDVEGRRRKALKDLSVFDGAVSEGQALLMVDDKPDAILNGDGRVLTMPCFAGDPEDRKLDELLDVLLNGEPWDAVSLGARLPGWAAHEPYAWTKERGVKLVQPSPEHLKG